MKYYHEQYPNSEKSNINEIKIRKYSNNIKMTATENNNKEK